MPRIRSVHPAICTSDSLAAIPAALERTYVRLWTHCDDEGRCPDHPKLIKAAIYPLHDDITAESLDIELDSLATKGFIVRYESEGVRYLQVVAWDKYQRPQKPRPSKYPTPHIEVRDADDNGKGLELGEGEGNRNTELGEGVIASAVRVRERDNIFDAVTAVCGIQVSDLTKSSRGPLNATVKQLREAGAAPEEIHRRAGNYRARYPDTTLTPTALAKHWPQLAIAPPPARGRDRNADQAERLLGGKGGSDGPGHEGFGAPQRGLSAG